MPDQGLQVRVEEGADYARVMRDIKAFDTELSKRIRRGLSAAAKPVVADVRQAVLSAPTRGRQTRNLRANIARGIRFENSTGARSRFQGVRIKATSRSLPENQKGMQRAFNKPSFRHPVFGDRSTWVAQEGHPYFHDTVRRHQATLRRAVETALRQAAEGIGK